jgi:uncharacterized YigZ family protein
LANLVDNFLTIDGKGNETLYKSKGSKFFSTAFNIDSDLKLKEIIDNLKFRHPKAGHHCYAYRINESYRTNDDGEPAHTAGDPILGQIDSFNLNNTLIVVSRIFGGTKLGVSGLIKAYKESAKEAIEAAIIIKQTRTVLLQASCSYDHLSSLYQFISKSNYKVVDQQLGSRCSVSVEVPQSHANKIDDKAKSIYQVEWSVIN